MTRLLIINPNTSPAMTASIERTVRAYAPPVWEIVAVTAKFGAPVIASRVSYAIAGHAVLDAFAEAGEDFDCAVIACFGDPGLEALRELTSVPVVGFAEAAIHAASREAVPFAVLTMGEPWVEMLQERIAVAGATRLLVDVFALDGTGLDALGGPESLVRALEGAVETAVSHGAANIILGGATLAGLGPRLPAGPRYIDCTSAAMAEAGEARRRLAARKLSDRRSVGLSTPLQALLARRP
jgi:Asp/Glu/hydantoin racemase